MNNAHTSHIRSKVEHVGHIALHNTGTEASVAQVALEKIIATVVGSRDIGLFEWSRWHEIRNSHIMTLFAKSSSCEGSLEA